MARKMVLVPTLAASDSKFLIRLYNTIIRPADELPWKRPKTKYIIKSHKWEKIVKISGGIRANCA